MSRPSPMPPSADHEQHDVLLVAQFAAEDALDEAQQRDAAALVSSCADCASLASDLRAVSGAVAREPIPPRRRDFRITTEQAERARATWLQRVIWRLAMPQGGSLRPLAAGMMSLGLVLVVAGNFWPQDLADNSTSVPASAPMVASTHAVEADGLIERERVTPDLERRIAASPASLPDDAAGTQISPPPAGSFRNEDPDLGAAIDELEASAAEEFAGFADDVGRQELAGQEAADTTRKAATKELRTSPSENVTEPPQPGLAEDLDAVEVGQDRRDQAAPKDERSDVNAPAAVATDGNAVVGNVAEAEAEAEAADVEVAPVAEGQVTTEAIGGASALETEVLADDAGIDVQTVLVVVGLALAVGGLLVLVMIWLARKGKPDPFLQS